MRLFRKITTCRHKKSTNKKTLDSIDSPQRQSAPSNINTTHEQEPSSPFVQLDTVDDVYHESVTTNYVNEKPCTTTPEEDELSSSVKTELRQTAQRYRQYAEEGFVSLSAMAFLGAIAIIFSSIHGFQEHGLAGFSYSIAMITLISWFSASFIVVLEGRTFLLDLPPFHRFVSNYMKMLKFVWGRGLFYILTGSLHICLGSQYSTITGISLLTVGFLMFVTGVVLHFKLKKLTKPSREGNLTKHVFNFYDSNNDGFLSLDNFRDLCVGLGIEGIVDVESEFDKLDADKDGLVTFIETRNWIRSINYTTKSILDNFEIIGLYMTE